MNYKVILFQINKRLDVKNKIISYLLKKYTYKIYKIGYDDGFNWNNKK